MLALILIAALAEQPIDVNAFRKASEAVRKDYTERYKLTLADLDADLVAARRGLIDASRAGYTFKDGKPFFIFEDADAKKKTIDHLTREAAVARKMHGLAKSGGYPIPSMNRGEIQIGAIGYITELVGVIKILDDKSMVCESGKQFILTGIETKDFRKSGGGPQAPIDIRPLGAFNVTGIKGEYLIVEPLDVDALKAKLGKREVIPWGSGKRW